uniref:RGS domain-containing protein n=1 Tax=Lotharella globosa TaxID=91324 RepID=A0A7S3Z4K9_9EUKA
MDALACHQLVAGFIYALAGADLIHGLVNTTRSRRVSFVLGDIRPVRLAVAQCILLYIVPLAALAGSFEGVHVPCLLVQAWRFFGFSAAMELYFYKMLLITRKLVRTYRARIVKAKSCPELRDAVDRIIKIISKTNINIMIALLTILHITQFLVLNLAMDWNPCGKFILVIVLLAEWLLITAAYWCVARKVLHRIGDTLFITRDLLVYTAAGIVATLAFQINDAVVLSPYHRELVFLWGTIPVIVAATWLELRMPVSREAAAYADSAATHTFKLGEIFLHSKTLEMFISHLFDEYSPENYYFYRDSTVFLAVYHGASLKEYPKMVQDAKRIYKEYIEVDAPMMVNIGHKNRVNFGFLNDIASGLKDAKEAGDVAHVLKSIKLRVRPSSGSPKSKTLLAVPAHKLEDSLSGKGGGGSSSESRNSPRVSGLSSPKDRDGRSQPFPEAKAGTTTTTGLLGSMRTPRVRSPNAESLKEMKTNERKMFGSAFNLLGVSTASMIDSTKRLCRTGSIIREEPDDCKKTSRSSRGRRGRDQKRDRFRHSPSRIRWPSSSRTESKHSQSEEDLTISSREVRPTGDNENSKTFQRALLYLSTRGCVADAAPPLVNHLMQTVEKARLEVFQLMAKDTLRRFHNKKKVQKVLNEIHIRVKDRWESQPNVST